MTSFCGKGPLVRERYLSCVGAVVLGLVPLACGHDRMLPASTTRVIPDAPGFAVVEQDGVRLAASGDDWTARPADLPDRLTPVRVRIVNHSGCALQILYSRFALAGARGRLYRPLPPVLLFHERPVDSAGTVRPFFASANFFVRQAYRDVYPSLPPWPTRLPSEDRFYEHQYKLWGRNLPTPEVQRMGLPEGVLDNGGQISGFLFFENATGRERKLLFKADLEEGQGDRTVTSISIPFRVE
jgi:hypothetical protein